MKRYLKELAIWFCIFNNVTFFLVCRCFDIHSFIFLGWWLFTVVTTFSVDVVLIHRMYGKKLKKLENEVLHKDS